MKTILCKIKAVFRPKTILELDKDFVDPDNAINRDAILNAYRCGGLEVAPSVVSVWFAGPLSNSGLRSEESIDKIPGWRKEYGLAGFG